MCKHLAVAPSVSLALGSVAGIGAARVATSHYSLIVRDTAQMMIAGPALVDGAGGGEVSKEDLGHWSIHTKNGAIDDAVDSEEEAFERTRALSVLTFPAMSSSCPSANAPATIRAGATRSCSRLIPRDPKRTYKMRTVLESVTDQE